MKMRFFLLALSLMSSVLLSGSAYAILDEKIRGISVCSTLEDCTKLRDLVDARIRELQPTPLIGDIARNADGSIRYMNQYDAVLYCANQGKRLPSARELAQFSMTFGAKGILEMHDIRNGDVPEGYHHVKAKNADGKDDSFYFNYAGYQPAKGDLGQSWLWSSSVDSEYSGFAYDLSGVYGDIDNFNRTIDNHAVRCAAGL